MKTLDRIIIGSVVIAILIGAGFVYPGDEQELLSYRTSGMMSMIKRILVFTLSGGLILFGIRYFLYQLLGEWENLPTSKSLLISSIILALTFAVLGSLYFFR